MRRLHLTFLQDSATNIPGGACELRLIHWLGLEALRKMSLDMVKIRFGRHSVNFLIIL